jgi:glycosyltransferase involved in cell wall biosynthesis
MKVLWVSPYALAPPTHGGRIRAGALVAAALRRGCTVEFWAFEKDPHPGASSDTLACAVEPNAVTSRFSFHTLPARSKRHAGQKILALLSPFPSWAWLLKSRAARSTLRSVIASGDFDAVVLEEEHLAWYAQGLAPSGIPVLIDCTNAEIALARRMVDVAEGHWDQFRLTVDWLKMLWFERRYMTRLRWVIAVTSADGEAFERSLRHSNVRVVRNGVNVERFRPSIGSGKRRRTVLFVGSLNYAPNADAARWLHDEIFPKVRDVLPSATFVVVGSSPPTDIVEMHAPERGFEVHGDVADVGPFWAEAAVFVVPLRAGGGSSLKVAEAFASGVPVVTTAKGIRGYGDEAEAMVTIASDATGIAQAIRTLLCDEGRRVVSVEVAREFAERHLNWTTIADGFIDLLEEAVGPSQGEIG